MYFFVVNKENQTPRDRDHLVSQTKENNARSIYATRKRPQIQVQIVENLSVVRVFMKENLLV